MKILVIHGPNLWLLGKREPEIYGNTTLDEINTMLRGMAENFGVGIEIFDSNSEGAIVASIGQAMGVFDGIVINPAAYTHTSVAIRDAIAATGLPTVEVHLSNVAARESYRHQSYTAEVALGVISGFGANSYLLAFKGLVDELRKE